MRRPSVALLALAVLAVTGCVNLGPDYQRPEVALPGQYLVQPDADRAANSAAQQWWAVYQDPTLQALIRKALDNNRDIQIAAARLDEARALLGPAELAQLPSVSAGANVSRNRLPQQGTFVLPPGTNRDYTLYGLTLNTSYELDFWGRIRSLVGAARADFFSTQFARDAVRISIIADVAATYFDTLALRREVAITRDAVGTREKFLDLTNRRFQAGRASTVDASRAEANLLQAQARLPTLEQQLGQLDNRMRVLLGSATATIPLPDTPVALPTPPDVPAGLPSELLERRPDLLAAEQNLIATNSRLKAQRAALYPSISLTDSLGQTSRQLGDLLGAPALTYSLGAALLQPIIDANRNKYQVQAAEAREQQAVFNYRKSVEQAFREVSDALIARQNFARLRDTVDSQVKTLYRLNDTVLKRYEAGLASYFEVIDAQRDLLEAELTAAEAQRNLLSSTVTLYKALGGGWDLPPQR